MSSENISNEFSQIVEKYGSWTAHNFEINRNFWTMGSPEYGDREKIEAIVWLITQLNPKNTMEELRILDLACLEGGYSIELGKLGAKVVGIEGRKQIWRKPGLLKES
ncbi:MAG: hypothetical protein IH840_07125 [Candidatus Heimdallarchaeota archaeon]|nr:hypothetical protein [Candidatus Heimdallarchaeota archaeon]